MKKMEAEEEGRSHEDGGENVPTTNVQIEGLNQSDSGHSDSDGED
jgi:hypothetical protein